ILARLGRQRGQVAVEARDRPAARGAVERMRPGSDRLVRSPLPVDLVVAALVSGSSPVADLVTTPSVGAEPMNGVVVLGGGPVLVLLRDRDIAPPAGAAARGQVIAVRAGQPLGIRIVEGQGVPGPGIRFP